MSITLEWLASVLVYVMIGAILSFGMSSSHAALLGEEAARNHSIMNTAFVVIPFFSLLAALVFSRKEKTTAARAAAHSHWAFLALLIITPTILN